ncbi:MAG: molybdenum cofactor guanylyltransferase [Ktedonobacteraceae bacterium]|nr:molybdenum cofactor guanylyltransferase [Ktedonobacteraceae bacterium]
MASSVAGILLAGGSSRRMGKDKALLPIPGREQVTFIEHLTSLLTLFCSEVILVTRDEDQAAKYIHHLATQEACPVHVVNDKIPAAGPLMGLYSGLGTIQASHALVVAVDMPFVHKDMLAFLLSYPLDEAVLVPMVENIPQVLLARYPRTILPQIETCLQNGQRDLRSLLKVVPVHYIKEAQLRTIDPQLRSFVNMNMPGDLLSVGNNMGL